MRCHIPSELRTLGHKQPTPQLCDPRRRSLRRRTAARSARTPCGKSTARRCAYLDGTVGEFVAALQNNTMTTTTMDYSFSRSPSSLRNKNTLIWFMTDNGGMPRLNKAQQGSLVAGAGCHWPLRGGKATVFEAAASAGSVFVGGVLLPSAAATGLRHLSPPRCHRCKGQ